MDKWIILLAVILVVAVAVGVLFCLQKDPRRRARNTRTSRSYQRAKVGVTVADRQDTVQRGHQHQANRQPQGTVAIDPKLPIANSLTDDALDKQSQTSKELADIFGDEDDELPEDNSPSLDNQHKMSLFVRLAGYHGLVVLLDEMSVLYKLASSQSRTANYEQILRIVNDVLQGSASHISFLFGGTNQFLNDPRRGLFSYKALQQRLADNVFTKDGLVDFSGPVIRLNSLNKEEFYALLCNVRQVFQSNNSMSLPDEALSC